MVAEHSADTNAHAHVITTARMMLAVGMVSFSLLLAILFMHWFASIEL